MTSYKKFAIIVLKRGDRNDCWRKNKTDKRRKRISQTELAEAIQTTKQNIYKYENNIISNIPSDKIEAIAKYLSVSPAYLMGWNDNEIASVDTSDENLIILNRNAKKLSPEKRKQLLDMARLMFKEEFDD